MSNGSMKNGSVVVIFLAKFDEILASFWDQVTVKFQVEVSLVGRQSNVALLFDTIIPEQEIME